MKHEKSQNYGPGPWADVGHLPLPKIIRYYDNFADKTRIIRTEDSQWRVKIDGARSSLDWFKYPKETQEFLKRYLVWLYAKYDATYVNNFSNTISRSPKMIGRWLEVFSDPKTAEEIWQATGYQSVSREAVDLVRSISKFMCEMSLCGWHPEDNEYLRGWKWYSTKNSSSVDHGDSYHLSFSEELSLISYFEKLSANSGVVFDLNSLRDACLLYFCYQFGMRRIQIASLTRNDVSVLDVGSTKSVYVAFHKAKQRKGQPLEPMLRKIKKEWAPILLRYLELDRLENAERSDLVNKDSLFNCTPDYVTARIRKLSECTVGKSIHPTLFRHIASQRMADLGMTQLELADFMGHTDTDSCLVYFENSAIQGQIVNRALGLSEVYQKIKKIAEVNFLSHEELNDVDPDKQVGGAAHGIALAGIGGCAIGQSLCQLNPAISCYTCPKFLPLNDKNVHTKVADELRDVIIHFEKSGRNDQSNPAFSQLTNTMMRISEIIKRMETSDE